MTVGIYSYSILTEAHIIYIKVEKVFLFSGYCIILNMGLCVSICIYIKEILYTCLARYGEQSRRIKRVNTELSRKS